ncbi:hypothetical protein P7K49_002970 [Saguinus oedipus]|uniref:SH3 domain-containing protein n=1 Tax=Saguinus oedipus TaxID=9490 RepID=A0ABQ9WKV8_SAGOE|nr:hypothetical protein P7K49_002970 [Saguinus oedipus]
MLQNRVLLWKEQSEASRSPSRAHSPGLLGPALGPPYPSGRLTPTRLDMVRTWAPPPLFVPPPPFPPPPLFPPSRAPRLEPPAPQASALHRAPQPTLPPRRVLGAPVVARPPPPEPLYRRLGLGVGAGLGCGPRPPRPTLPCPSPPQPPRPLGEFSSPRSRHSSGSYGPEPDARPASQLEPDRRGAGVGLRQEGWRADARENFPPTCRRALPPAASLYSISTQSSRSNSFGERPGGGGGGGGARRVRALVSHSEGANHTLLRFSAGDVVEVLVPEAQNGWLYGKLEGSSA